MFYVSKINIENNTARAKHIRSLIVANKSIDFPLEFVFYNFKRPFNNLKFWKTRSFKESKILKKMIKSKKDRYKKTIN